MTSQMHVESAPSLDAACPCSVPAKPKMLQHFSMRRADCVPREAHHRQIASGFFGYSLSCEALVKQLGSVKPVNSRLALRIAAGLTPAAECRCFDVLSTEIYVQVALRASNNTISSTFASSFLVIPLHVHCICFLSSAHAIVDDRLPAIPRGAHIGHVRRPRTYCLWDISTCPGSQHRHCQCTMPQMAPPSPRAQRLRSCSRQRHSRGAAHPRYVTLANADCLPSTR